MTNKLIKKLDNNSSNNRLFIIGGVILLAIGFGLWFNSIYLNPTNIFWDSLSNDLSTAGFTKEINNSTSQTSVKQTVQIVFCGNSYAHSITTLTQSGTTVVTEEINSPDSEYVRYLNISTANNGAKNYKPVLNLWGYQKSTKASGAQSTRTFYQTIFGIIPFGNLTPEQRNNLMSIAKKEKVYTVNTKDVTHETVAGKKVDTLKVNVNLQGYIKLMKTFAGYVGFKGLDGIDPSQYSSQKPVAVKISIEPVSRNLVQIDNGTATGKSQYSGFGADPMISLPKEKISLTELEKKVQAIK
jgi:hypothetical protein